MKTFRLLLLILIAAPGPVLPPIRAVAEDCAVCGHACCCPEMCKPLLEKMKKEKSKKVADCNQSMSQCKMGAPQTAHDFSTPIENHLICSATPGVLDRVYSKTCFHAVRRNMDALVLKAFLLRQQATPPPKIS